MRKILLFLFSLFIFNSFLIAEQISNDTKELNISDFSGGLNTSVVPYKLDSRFSPNMQNIDIDNLSGRLKKIKGYVVLGATTSLSEINLIVPFFVEGQPKEYIVSDSSIVLTTRDFVNFTPIKAGLNKNYLLDAIVARDKVWFSNGNDPVFTYDLSTVTVLDGRTYSGTQTPNVPRGKMLSYYHERVFIYNSTYSASALHYSAVSSTDGIAINPDDYRAWPLTNTQYADNGNGNQGTSIWIYQGKLFLGKINAMYVLNGTNEDTYFIQKINNEVGPISKDGITILNDILYFKGKIDFYASDGVTAKRIGENIYNEVTQFGRTDQNLISDIWPNKYLFSYGNSNGFSVFQSSLSLKLRDLFAPLNCGLSSDCVFDFTTTTSTHWQTFEPGDLSIAPYGDYSATFGYIQTNVQTANFSSGEILRVCLSNKNTNAMECRLIDPTVPIVGFFYSNSTFPFKVSEIMGSSVAVRMELMNSTPTGGDLDKNVGKIWQYSKARVELKNTTGSYVSNTATITTITNWDNLNADYSSNGGVVKFFFRTAPSSAFISTQTFYPITPGQAITAPSNDMYIQYGSSVIAAEFDAVSDTAGMSPLITRVQILHNEGGSSSQRTILIPWDNRLWVSGSTSPSSTQKYMLMKSRLTNDVPNAWMPIIGINCSSFRPLEQDNLFLAGSSTAGVILRLDYGTNFNGSAIDAFYDTPDFNFSNNFFKKEIFKYLIDIEKQTNATLLINTKIDDNDWVENSVDITGSGRYLGALNNINSSGYRYRFRFRNNNLDQDLKLNSFSVLYKNTTRGN